VQRSLPSRPGIIDCVSRCAAACTPFPFGAVPNDARSSRVRDQRSNWQDRVQIGQGGADDDPAAKGDQYFVAWAALQARFSEQPPEAGASGNDLIREAF
jgi:hypothetical protein